MLELEGRRRETGDGRRKTGDGREEEGGRLRGMQLSD